MPLSGSIAIGAGALAITRTARSTSGRITQLRAGGVNGFATSQPAGSRSTIGAPVTRRQASSSNESSRPASSPT